MNNKFSKSDYIIFSFAIIGIAFYLYLYHQISPRAGIHLKLSKKQIETLKAKAVELNAKGDGDQACFYLHKVQHVA